MDTKRLKELAGMQLNEGLTPVNWNNVAQVLAMEIVKEAYKNDKSLFSEDFEYVIGSLEDELPDFIIDKVYSKVFPQMKQEVKAIQQKLKGK